MECCAESLCALNCPGEKPLECFVSSCSCEPESCCFLQCPGAAAAPAVGSGGLGFLAVALRVGGTLALVGRERRRRRSVQ